MTPAKPKSRFQALVKTRNDDKGTVAVSLYLRNGRGPVKGNVTRTFSVANAKVSDVASFVEDALFGAKA